MIKPLAIATEGYLCTSKPLAIATNGYICTEVDVPIPPTVYAPSASGGVISKRKQLNIEGQFDYKKLDDEDILLIIKLFMQCQGTVSQH